MGIVIVVGDAESGRARSVIKIVGVGIGKSVVVPAAAGRVPVIEIDAGRGWM